VTRSRCWGKNWPRPSPQTNSQREALFLLTQAGRIRGPLYQPEFRNKNSRKHLPERGQNQRRVRPLSPSPEFLADELARCLDELGVETLDGFLLQDPDFYLLWAEKAGIARQEAQKEYRRRLQEAFPTWRNK
jgi:hypothetical protein